MADPRASRLPNMLNPGPNNAVYGQDGLEFYDHNSVLRYWISPRHVRAMVFDDSGVTRAEMGLLDLNGVSPAQYGFRANDASGTPIFDSMGLIQHTQELVTVSYISNSSTTSTTDVAVPTTAGAVASFTLARATSVLILTKFTAKTSGASGFFGYTQLNVNGQPSHGQGLWDKGNGGYTGEAYFVVYALPAGTFTASITWWVDAGQTLITNGGFLTVLRLGG